MTNKMNTSEQLNRMKSLMNYGLQTEGKQAQYSSVEYKKLGADGKVYGIVREGSKYYIKEAPNTKNLVKESFDYIGGFRNRKNNEYSNFALAQKQFDLKMMSLKEANNKSDFNIDSWNLDKKENVVIEASDKMKGEILRERQIMKNATMISESCKGGVCKIEKEFTDTQKSNIKGERHQTGDAKKAVKNLKAASLPSEMTESAEVLAWHDSHGNPKGDDYMDKSRGTQIGDSAPFNKGKGRDITDKNYHAPSTGDMSNGVVEEGESMHDTDNQNSPEPGTNKIGDSQPFNKKKGKDINEALDDMDADGDVESDDAVDVDDASADDFGTEDGNDYATDDTEEYDDDDLDDENVEVADLQDRMDSMEDLLGQIANALGVDEPTVDDEAYDDDDDLWGDDADSDTDYELEYDDDSDDDDTEYELESGDDDDMEGNIEDDVDMDMPMESRRRNGVQIFETRNFKRAMRNHSINEDGMKPFTDNGRVPSGNMNKLNDFSKHPSWGKSPMTLPKTAMQEYPGYYDMNDDSVYNEKMYGERIGNGAPFEIHPETVDNAIAEAFKRLKKKI
jgi:hypothetical protein